MSSILNTTSNVKAITRLPSHITKSEVLSVLHSDAAMLSLNPLLKSSTLLPPSGSSAFYKSVPKDLKPASKEAIENTPVYSVVEAHGGSGEEATWRGGWAKRFIPDEIVYDTSMQNKETGMLTVTHAPMGVSSHTMWTVRESTETDPPVAEDGNKSGLVLEVSGSVESNRMLMGFIKTTLQGSYDKLAKDFVILLEKEVAKKRAGAGNAPDAATDKLEQPAGDQQVEVEVAA